jgi:hypothetical protein
MTNWRRIVAPFIMPGPIMPPPIMPIWLCAGVDKHNNAIAATARALLSRNEPVCPGKTPAPACKA